MVFQFYYGYVIVSNVIVTETIAKFPSAREAMINYVDKIC